MKTPLFHRCLALAASLAATLAFAQDVARLKDVKGNVLVSRESGLAAGAEATRIPDHVRVITAAGSEVTVVFDNGCEVKLKENERLEVESEKPCAALLTASLLAAPVAAAAAAAAGASLVSVLPAVGGLGAIGVQTYNDFRRRPPPISPN